MTGIWKGYYKYGNEWAQQASGFDRTGFTITIHSFDGIEFHGTVNDDTATGGMKGTGKITGTLKDDVINFQKFMPEGSLLHPGGTHELTAKVHNTLYYSGKLLKEGQFTGKWKFRKRIAFLFGIIPIPYSPGTGTWVMTRQ